MTKIERVNLESEDLVTDRIEQMRRLFPEIFVEPGLEERERERVNVLRA